MITPSNPDRGDTIQPWARHQSDFSRSNRIIPGKGILARVTTKGTQLDINLPKSLPSVIPLHILRRRPRYIPVPAEPAEEGYLRYYIEWGVLNDKLATNWAGNHDLNITTYFFAKATLRTTDNLLITSWEILTGPAEDTHATADWLVGDPRPAAAVYLLGSVQVTDGVHTILNSGGGSLLLTEHITNIEPGTGSGDVKYAKQLAFHRQTY